MDLKATPTAKHSLVQSLHQKGTVYAQRAESMSELANQLKDTDTETLDEAPMTEEEARGRAEFAASCAVGMRLLLENVQQGDPDWEYLLELEVYLPDSESGLGNDVTAS